jgi:hypothetical protein
MKGWFLFLFIWLFLCNKSTAQCDSSADIRQVFLKLNIDKDFSFLQKTTMHLRPSLDAESLNIIKKAFATGYFTRQLEVAGRYITDTLKLEPAEILFLDSVSRNISKWTKSKVAACRIGRRVNIYAGSSKTGSGTFITTYQILEPVFLRKRTIALTFYKREVPDKYAVFTVLAKTAGVWETWTEVMVMFSPSYK